MNYYSNSNTLHLHFHSASNVWIQTLSLSLSLFWANLPKIMRQKTNNAGSSGFLGSISSNFLRSISSSNRKPTSSSSSNPKPPNSDAENTPPTTHPNIPLNIHHQSKPNDPFSHSDSHVKASSQFAFFWVAFQYSSCSLKPQKRGCKKVYFGLWYVLLFWSRLWWELGLKIVMEKREIRKLRRFLQMPCVLGTESSRLMKF